MANDDTEPCLASNESIMERVLLNSKILIPDVSTLTLFHFSSIGRRLASCLLWVSFFIFFFCSKSSGIWLVLNLMSLKTLVKWLSGTRSPSYSFCNTDSINVFYDVLRTVHCTFAFESQYLTHISRHISSWSVGASADWACATGWQPIGCLTDWTID